MGLAAIWILYFHVGGEPLFSNSLFEPLGKFLLAVGYYGVDIFILLAGIGVYHALGVKGQSTAVFLKRRVIRVYPAFLILFLYGYMSPLGPMQWKAFFRNVTFYENWTVTIYSGGWYVAAILAFYLLTPLYFKVFSKSKQKVLVTLLVSMM